MTIETAQKLNGFNTRSDREKDDFYATPSSCTVDLLKREQFQGTIFEPCCGMGHISKVFIDKGYEVESSDLVNRGFGISNRDFLFEREQRDNVVTNPPFKMALDIAEHSQKIARYKIALLLKLSFLEGVERKKFFHEYPPQRIWVFSRRQSLMKNGIEQFGGGMMALAWFVWETGSTKAPVIGWLP
tara:strand:+ start:297 stop:854 length:558 start_codon:yes stop_codon:yes gene_type:complete